AFHAASWGGQRGPGCLFDPRRHAAVPTLSIGPRAHGGACVPPFRQSIGSLCPPYGAASSGTGKKLPQTRSSTASAWSIGSTESLSPSGRRTLNRSSFANDSQTSTAAAVLQ